MVANVLKGTSLWSYDTNIIIQHARGASVKGENSFMFLADYDAHVAVLNKTVYINPIVVEAKMKDAAGQPHICTGYAANMHWKIKPFTLKGTHCKYMWTYFNKNKKGTMV